MKFVITLTSLFLLLLCSCQKEIELNNITTRTDSTAIVNDSATLIKYVDLDTTQPTGMDTMAVVKYTYDNLKRVTQFDYVEYGTTGSPERNLKTVLYYNGSDTLPYKKLLSDFVLPYDTVYYSTTSFYFYTNGKLTSDTSALLSNFNQQLIRKARWYSYTGNRINVRANYYPTANGNLDHTEIRNYYLTKVNGNTTLQTDTFQNTSTTISKYSFSYDNKKNPFYRLPQTPLSDDAPYYDMITLSEEMVYEKNNPTVVDEYENTYRLLGKYTYEYNANGYPTISRYIELSGGTTLNFQYKRLFFYR